MGLLRKFLHILIRFRTTIRWASIFDFCLSDRVIVTQSWVLEADFLTLTLLGAHQILHTGRRVPKMGRCVSC